MADIIQIRRDTAANWTAANPILAQGEPALEIDTKKEKIGDGVTAWNSLPYKSSGTGSFETEVNAAITKATPVDADRLGLTDSVASFAVKKFTWANLKTTLKTYLDGFYVFLTDFLEEKLLGTATYNATTTGAANLDLSVFATHYAILTGNTTHTLTGLPSSGKSTVKTLYVKSTTTQTYAISNADFEVGAYVADGTLNRVTIEATVFPTVGQIITVTYENLI